MAQVQERRSPAPLSAADRRLLAGAGAVVTIFAGAVAYALGTASQRPLLLLGTLLATLLVALIGVRWRRDPSPSRGRHRDDPRGFKSRQERRFWDE
jgi:hypothetical protein